MDYFHLTLLAANHPTACVEDVEQDRWHAACLIRFIDHRSDPLLTVYRGENTAVEPYGPNDTCFDVGSGCPFDEPTMTTAPEGPWTSSP